MIDNKIGVIDLFCGVGGLSHGMHKVGFNIIAGYDIDRTCSFAFENNNSSTFIEKDVAQLDGSELIDAFRNCKIKVLAGCAPCQPFSSYSFKVKNKDQKKYNLLYQFGRLVKESAPDIVTMENVSQIESFNQKPVLIDFVNQLGKLGYHVSYQIVFCPDYGIPQTRKRLVLLASKFGSINLVEPTHTKENYITVADTISQLPELKAGETCKDDPIHRARSLSELNLMRIKATPYGGSWKDWPEELKLECHKRDSGKSFASVYGRMAWDLPSPTMTTLCTGLGNGRFGHPTQNRAISIREAALLQTFPKDYKFFEDEKGISISKASRYIGNAVPPKLGEITALSIKQHLETLNLI